MHFVDEVDLVAATGRRVLHVFEQFTRVIDLGARGCVDLDQVQEPPGVDLPATGAFPTGLRRNAPLAIEALGKDARDRGLAHAAGTGKQEGMVNATGIQRVAQSLEHMLLARHFGEGFGAPLAGQSGIGHGLWGRRGR